MNKINKRNFHKLSVWTVAAVLFMSACSNGDDINSLINREDSLETVLKDLQQAFDNSKIISSVSPFEQDYKGYLIAFSDGSAIKVKDGEADPDDQYRVTPFIKIDMEGYWIVSYDDCLSYTRLTDNNGAVVSAHDYNVKVGLIDDKYVINLYNPADPDNIVESIKTTYLPDFGDIVQSVVENQQDRVMVITMADGSVFPFSLDIQYPTGIVLLTDNVVISPEDKQTSFEFRLNPSNAYMNFAYAGDNANLQLDMISTTRSETAESFVTIPENYRIVDVVPSVNEDGKILVGQYTVTIEAYDTYTKGRDKVSLVLTTKDGKGNQVKLSSSLMTIEYGHIPYIGGINVADIDATRYDASTYYVKLPYDINASSLPVKFETKSNIIVGGQENPTTVDLSNPVTITAYLEDKSCEYSLIACYSELPVVYVNTPAPVTSKENWVKKSTIQIANAGEYNAIYEDAQLKGRGNTTWSYPKKPYAVKLDKKGDLLGMPKHKRWCLLANWLDRTNIRNEVAYEIGRRLPGLEWTPRGRFVDMVYNGKYVGNYYLCEQIKIDSNRVNIDELDEGDISGDNLTGGYLLELDSYFDEVNKFRSNLLNLPVNFKDPDEDILQPEQFAYMQNYFNNMESLLSTHHPFSEIEALLDVDSYIDWWLLHELTGSGEPNHPKSSYMYKKRKGKLYAGPVWDFDWGTYRDNGSSWKIKNAIWYQSLFKYSEFVEKVKERWELNKAKLATIPEYIDELAEKLWESVENDEKMWPITQVVNGDEELSFRESILRLKSNYINRYNWIDQNISKL
ncbi:MAG: hypothetical protein HDS35_04055 [Bacteroides sp.]|nr:hypothetical protein [Bacteroides sp.]